MTLPWLCSMCRGPRERASYRYCRECANAYMREWRKTHPLNPGHRRRDAARSYANSYKKRGVLKPQPCQHCGATNSEMHHIDHERPLDVTWLCRECHLAWHSFWREMVLCIFREWVGGPPHETSRLPSIG